MNEATKRTIKRGLVGLTVVGCIALVFFIYIANSVLLPPLARQSSNLRRVGISLLAYAEHHDGQLPPRLSALVPEFFPSENDSCLTYHDPDSKHRYEWLYLHRATLSALPPDAILAAAPRPCAAKGTPAQRLVLYRDGNKRWTPESDFQRLFREHLLHPTQ